jgi:hypothetical protein
MKSQAGITAAVLSAVLLAACVAPPAINPGASVPSASAASSVATPTTAWQRLSEPTPGMPDIPATVVALEQPRHHASNSSPDKRWRAEVIVYDCVRTDDGQENAYEELLLTEVPGSATRTADSQLRNCGGLGAFGLEGLFWSPNTRYFYYTELRQRLLSCYDAVEAELTFVIAAASSLF